MKIIKVFIFVIIFSIPFKAHADIVSVLKTSMSSGEFFQLFNHDDLRTYRDEKSVSWKTIWDQDKFLTLKFKDDLLDSWKINDRPEIAREYISEFAQQDFDQKYPKISRSLQIALEKLPLEVFEFITRREFPIIFSEYHTQGIGRFANSSQIVQLPDDPPTFTSGVFICKLSTELEGAQNLDAIIGIIAHEIAHRYLRHLNNEVIASEMEREANHLIQDWGFEQEFQAAKNEFGRQHEMMNTQ